MHCHLQGFGKDAGRDFLAGIVKGRCYMKFTDIPFIAEEIPLDERQKAIIGEISTDCIRLWYVLNAMATFFAAAFMLTGLFPIGETYAAAVIAVYWGITFFCLSVYDIKSAAKGVLTPLMGLKLNNQGILFSVFMYLFAIYLVIMDYRTGSGILSQFTAGGIICLVLMFIVGIIYDIIHFCSCRKNQRVNEQMMRED